MTTRIVCQSVLFNIQLHKNDAPINTDKWRRKDAEFMYWESLLMEIKGASIKKSTSWQLMAWGLKKPGL